MNRAATLAFCVLFFAMSSGAQSLSDSSRASVLPDHIQPARSAFARPFLDTRDAFLFKDKAESILAVTQGFFLISDGIITRIDVRDRSHKELNPATRVFLGSYPTWNRMAPLGAVQEIVGIYLGTEMKRSRNRFIRKAWWVPQAVGIGGNLSGAAYGLITRSTSK